MSTSFMAAFSEPRDSSTSGPVLRQGAACFGSFNRVDNLTSDAELLEVMEWHPRVAPNCPSAKECFDFINSMGPWKGVYHLTSVGTIAVAIRNIPADRVITGLMAARNYNLGYNNLERNRIPDGIENLEAQKLFYIAYCAGASINSFGEFTWNDQGSTGEDGMCLLTNETDAYALYLLAYGTEEECSDLFFQDPLFSDGPNENGYLRDSSSNMPRFRSRLPSSISSLYRSLGDWMKCYLVLRGPATGKLGRLTVGQFKERHRSRGNTLASLFDMFEELKDLYS